MKDWNFYCETTFNSLKANVHNWGDPVYARPITRIYYIGVFDCGVPNQTGFISEAAYQNKLSKKKVVHDHYLSPQFIGRMILDNPDIYLEDYEKFRNLFWLSCSTIVLTQKENDDLSFLTKNDGETYKVKVPTDKKYDALGIKLYKRLDGKNRWKYSEPTDEKPHFPKELLEYERQFLIRV